MFVPITNTPRPYAWGSKTAIAEQLGTQPSGQPEAELWLGAHPGSPSRILDPTLTGGATTLEEWIDQDPTPTLGPFAASGRLPFLLKLLAADAPLSLQAHPTPEQAREGFERENAAGIPLDAPERNYKDPYAKPELIYALSERFEALCGFRPVADFRGAIEALDDPGLSVLLNRAGSDADLPELVKWLSDGGSTVAAIIERVSSKPNAPELVQRLARDYPGDPGIVIAMLLHHVVLTRGQALFLPAGNIHAYLSGFGVELMNASDNVLRGGLTPKHVDVPELLRVLDFSVQPVPYLEPSHPASGGEVFAPDAAGFRLVHFSGEGSIALDGPAIAVCTSGSAELSGASSVHLERGDIVYITPDEGGVTVTGGGEVFVATTG